MPTVTVIVRYLTIPDLARVGEAAAGDGDEPTVVFILAEVNRRVALLLREATDESPRPPAPPAARR